MTESRRQREQAALRRDVLAVAAAQLEDGGPTALRWRAVAREVGVGPSTLYTYFDGVDGLVTAVLVDAYAAMAEAVATAAAEAGPDPTARIVAAAGAYRTWALAHRGRFTLLFTDVLEGYAAPEGGPTVDAQTALLAPLARALAEEAGVDPSAAIEDWPEALRRTGLGLWGQVHGLVSLEVNHHLDWVDGAEREGLVAERVRALLARSADAP